MGERSEEGAPLELRQEPECWCPTLDAAGEVTFGWRVPGPRYYLYDQGVHAGDTLEMLLDDGVWKRVRYEYTWDATTRTLEAFLYFCTERYAGLRPDMRFRWPTDAKGK